MAAVGTKELDAGPWHHLVQFYEHDAELVEGVGGYLLGALTGGGVAIAIATPAHRRAFAAWLEDAGIDVVAARERGAYLDLDAAQLLARLMVDSRPARFDEVIGGLIRSATQVADGGLVRAFGEMVAVLWDDGLVNAAIELETRWNELGQQHRFSLFCAYPVRTAAAGDVCPLHTRVVGTGPCLPIVKAFERTSSAPAEARRFAVDAVPGLGAAGLADDVALIVTELTANAVLHAESAFTLALSVGRGVLRVSVRDGSGLPREGLPGAGLPAQPMHGLGLVSALASEWGVQALSDDGKVVWAELAVG